MEKAPRPFYRKYHSAGKEIDRQTLQQSRRNRFCFERRNPKARVQISRFCFAPVRKRVTIAALCGFTLCFVSRNRLP
jgi:hypothetical protein